MAKEIRINLRKLNKSDKDFILNLLSDIIQGNNDICILKIKSFRLLNDF